MVAKVWPKIFDLVYVDRRRDGSYEVENCLYDVQDGENPYPDPEPEFYYEFREKVWWEISPPTTFIANELITSALKAKRSENMLKSNVCTLLNNTWCATLPTIGVEVNCWWGGAFYVARWTKQSPGAKIHNGPSPPPPLPSPNPPTKDMEKYYTMGSFFVMFFLNSNSTHLKACVHVYICHKILPFLPGAKFSNILLLHILLLQYTTRHIVLFCIVSINYLALNFCPAK